MSERAFMQPKYTTLQGLQYLAFIYYYSKLMKRSPAEADFQIYFEVSPPTVHQMFWFSVNVLLPEKAKLLGRGFVVV